MKPCPIPLGLPQDWDSLYAATLESIQHPIGMKPLRELAGPGKTVVFVIPDIVKGGTQPTSHFVWPSGPVWMSCTLLE